MTVSNRRSRSLLTEKQSKILDFVRSQVLVAGMPPTHEEIRQEFGLRSAYGVRQHLQLIERKGYLELCAGRSRGIRLRKSSVEPAGTRSREIPVVGQIAAGQQMFAEENLVRQIAIDGDLFPAGTLFALRVHGDSMVNVGIASGDLAVIQQQSTVDNGQIAAVLCGHEATLKRVYFHKNYVRLKSENDQIPELRIASNEGVDVRILGLYVGLIRRTW